jgi:hypothetical protein
VREADGKLLIDDVVLDALPRFAGAAAEILRRAGLLDSTCDRLPGRRGSLHRVGPGPRSCQTCGAWGTRRRCEACRQWEASGSCEPGTCQRCGHADVPLRGGRCRACLVHIRAHGPAAACQSWVQLWFALPGASGPPGPARLSDAGRQETVPAVSPYCIDPAQLALFTMRRDWRPALDSAWLPALTGAAQRLLDNFSGAQPSPGDEAAGRSARALRILVPVLTGWASRHASLREVTRQDILDAVDARHGPVIQHRIVALRRGLQRRVIYLDEVTAALASQWLRYRHQRWPGSRNPHLLVSQQTAADASLVGPTMIWDMFEPLGVHPVRLRQDRILDEARHTADPVHLVRVFGITESTAIYYVHAAHPGRQSVIPRQ